MADQGSRVDAGDYGDAAGGQELLGGFVGAPVARQRGEFADGQAFDVRLGRFAVRFIGSVVADLGVGEHHDLAGVGRVSEYFLIAGDSGIENDFAGTFDRRTKTVSLE